MLTRAPEVSVVVCTYNEARRRDLDECVGSLLRQSFRDLEILIVVDHNQELYRALSKRYGDSEVTVILNDCENVGQASSRNLGVKNSRANVICFIDDDAVADENWLSCLVGAYDVDTVCVGGRTEPLWLDNRPTYLPEEFYWMVGATGKYLPTRVAETRNLWTSNVSYKRTLFGQLGVLSERIGRGHNSRLFQGEDTEFGVRLSKKMGKSVKYLPTAKVYHKISADRLKLPSLLKRAYEQGYVKAYISRLHGISYGLSVERAYLRSVIRWDLERLERVVFGPERKRMLEQHVFTLCATVTVLIGFAIGLAKAIRSA